MTDFILTPTALRVIRNLAGREDDSVITRALGCSRFQLDRICREHRISLKRDDEREAR